MDPENWPWVWLGIAAAFGIGEMAAAGTFFLMPFAVGAAAAFLASWLGAAVVVQWALFLGVSGGAFAALRPIARRLDADYPSEGIGANRLIGAQARVLEAISEAGGGQGLVRIDRQEWRAESFDGEPIEAGGQVRVVEVRGTRVIVVASELPPPDNELDEPNPFGSDDLPSES